MNRKQQFEQDGYLVIKDLLPLPTLAHIQQVVDQLLAQLPPRMRMEEVELPHVDPSLWTEENRIGKNWGRVSSHHEFFLQLAANPHLLDVVEELLGPDIVLFSSHLIAKTPGIGYSKPWHQDGYYWNLEPRDEVLTLWLAIDDSRRENGCLRIYPGSHQLGLLPHERTYFAENQRSSLVVELKNVAGNPIDLELTAGSCSLHHAYAVHGSEPNRSPWRRAGHTITYMSARTRVLDWTNLPLYLLRGKPVAGVNTYVNL